MNFKMVFSEQNGRMNAKFSQTDQTFGVKLSSSGGSNSGGGQDGFSPVVEITEISGGHRVSITDKYGTQVFDVLDGKQGPKGDKGPQGSQGPQGPQGVQGDPGPAGNNGISVTHRWSGTTLYITSASGTSSADLKGEKGPAGPSGSNGSDGFSPTVSVYAISGGHRVNITDKSGTKSFDVLNGAKGDRGEQGIQGEKGAAGTNGKDGYTPVKGKDYFTDADKAEMVSAVIASLPVYNGEVTTV